MKKAKIKVTIKSARGSSIADFESDIPTAKTPATPLQTLISAAEHLAISAEIYAQSGDELISAVSAAVQRVKDRAKAAA